MALHYVIQSSQATSGLLLFLLPAVSGALIGGLFGWIVSRLNKANQNLDKSGKRLRYFYTKTPAMIHSMDGDGHILAVSQTWIDTFGYTRDEIIGKDFFDLVIADNPATVRKEHFLKLDTLGEIKDLTYQIKHADGFPVEVSLSEIPQRNADGAVTETLAVLNDLRSHRAAEERIEKLAYYDTLTGLPNRALMNDRILQAMAQSKRDNRHVGIFFFDLDRFKLINDTQGHAVGDMVLRSVAQRLKKFIRQGDTFARLGGDEFVIVQADPNHEPNFEIMGQRIIDTLGQPFQIGSREFFTTASVGVAIYPIDGDDPQSLLKSADTAMYVAKSRGRNNVQFFSDEMNAATLAKTSLESRLRKALSSGELQQHYQPQVDLATGRITGVEALLRWYDNEGKLIPPNEIISIAEESGLIFPLGEWVVQTACAQAKAWQEAGLPHLRMSVNLSGHHIRQSNFIDRIESILAETGIKPNTLEIELAENSVMNQVDDSVMALTDLKIRGISLAIDDFGTGYSSLLYLKHFPIHRIKIAKEFILDITQNPDYASITEAILSMAESLKIAVTAVGVEDKAQLAFLRDRGCREVQGSIYGSAMSAEEMTRFLSNPENLSPGLGVNTSQGVLNFESSKEIH